MLAHTEGPQLSPFLQTALGSCSLGHPPLTAARCRGITACSPSLGPAISGGPFPPEVPVRSSAAPCSAAKSGLTSSLWASQGLLPGALPCSHTAASRAQSPGAKPNTVASSTLTQMPAIPPSQSSASKSPLPSGSSFFPAPPSLPLLSVLLPGVPTGFVDCPVTVSFTSRSSLWPFSKPAMSLFPVFHSLLISRWWFISSTKGGTVELLCPAHSPTLTFVTVGLLVLSAPSCSSYLTPHVALRTFILKFCMTVPSQERLCDGFPRCQLGLNSTHIIF